MGEVYVARDTRRSKAARDASERAASNEKASGDRRDTHQVLLKLLAPELLGDVALAERFHREGEALSRLTHPGVQRWIESGHSGRRPYVALAYVRGTSLNEVLTQRGVLPEDDARRIVALLADALSYCHTRGVIHRDVTPENVVVAEDGGRPVLIDFGNAMLEGARRLTFAGLSGELGTPAYMAPEQVRGERGDARTDIYALGTLLYALLTGAPPFAPREGDGAVRVMQRHLEEDPARPNTALGIGAPLLGIVARAIQRDPSQRFASAAEFRDALADPDVAVTRATILPSWPATGSGDAELGERRRLTGERMRYAVGAGAALLALSLAGVLARWLRAPPAG